MRTDHMGWRRSRRPLGKDEARKAVHGMPLAEWNAKYQKQATPEQLAAFCRRPEARLIFASI